MTTNDQRSFKGEKMAKVTFNSLIYKAHNYYVAAGMTPEGAAALEGNQYAESAGFIPKRLESIFFV